MRRDVDWIRGLRLSLAVIIGAGLIALGVYMIADFEPQCRSSATWKCVPSEESQRTSIIIYATFPMAVGSLLILYVIWQLVDAMRDSYRRLKLTFRR